jgi:3-isopropylmalate/(R)-2-methylmalate dehydratase small subunit
MAEKFTSITALAAPYEPVNVDTDQIIPARFLKFARGHGYGKFLFHDLRGNPGFVPLEGAKILVANANFGCGSSREGAAYAFHDAGFRSIIAPSFGDIFFRNCLKNGIVPVRLAGDTCAHLRAMLRAKPGTELTVDLEKQVVVEPGGKAHDFSLDPFFRSMLLQGLDELGLTLSLVEEIERFERAYPYARLIGL